MRYPFVLAVLLSLVWAVAFGNAAAASQVTSTTQIVDGNIVVTYAVVAEPDEDPIPDLHILPPVTRTGGHQVAGTQPPGGCPEHWDVNVGGAGVSWRMGDGEREAIQPGTQATFQLQVPNTAATGPVSGRCV